MAESEEQRDRRERLRTLFDGVADLYDATRQSYPDEVVGAMLTTAGVTAGASVLEIGCGTGQLTARLAARGLEVTALDIGPSMIRAARRNVTDPRVRFVCTPFEDFAGGDGFDLIVSATAFHWVDPDVAWTKAARLLQAAGWLALLSTGEQYEEPLRSQLRRQWETYSRQQVNWTNRPGWVDALRETDLFGEVVEETHRLPLSIPAETVIGVECTRATFLSYPPDDQQRFAADLRRLLDGSPLVDLTQETHLAMARCRARTAKP